MFFIFNILLIISILFFGNFLMFYFFFFVMFFFALSFFFKKLKKQIDDSDHVFVETIRFLSMLKIWYLLRYIYLNKVYYFIFKLCKLLLEMVIKLLPKIKKKLIIEHKRLCNDFIVKRYNFLLNIADKSKFNYNKKRC